MRGGLVKETIQDTFWLQCECQFTISMAQSPSNAVHESRLKVTSCSLSERFQERFRVVGRRKLGGNLVRRRNI